jgi:hypothetical protein
MINFFRKIRKQLANDNKPLKYARYAIGEIFLVVIGILIALSINNWNENQKRVSLEQKLLTEVRDGLAFDLQEIKGTLQFQKSIINSQKKATEWLQSDLPFSDSLATDFMRSMFTSNFIFKSAPYETLKQIGLEIIKNGSLRDQISNMYDLKYESLFFANRDLFNFKEQYLVMMGDNRFELLDKSDPFSGFRPLRVLELKSDKTFQFKLNMLIGIFIINNRGLQQIIVEIEELIKKINLELASR